ncbi:hypothetical protein TanjilG_19926 [Lupinus angustifolius]|uniref:Uncharacterized protein n=1 Tax=Lupinus angustifolius TaxID=3871 RepID=A0A1J7G8W7_LUPAN|nr:PREDICTED: uncharacterized protein DDB_G0271670-like [Lupinus angustifolius]OIV96767.1 hypothetical protein TanjilG_19926 [Lupinus angustifolius]
MGCCISKCIPNKPSHEDQHKKFNHVHDNLIISQTSPTSSIIVPRHSSKNISPSPHSPTSSTSTITSFTCTTTSNTTISSSTSSLSSASSTFTSKDKSFSNDFLWSCYKDNPHIIRINSLREATTTLPLMPIKPKKHQPRNIKPSSPKHSFAPKKLSPPQNVVVGSSSMTHKRVRSNSPVNLTRQKSFRKHTNSTVCLTPDVKDFDRSKNIGESHIIVGQLSQKEPERSNNIPSRMLGSPSPSRMSNINGDKYCGSANNSASKSMINAPKVSAAHSSHRVSSSASKENFKAANPNNTSRRFHNGLKHREICTAKRVGSDETMVNDVLSDHNMDSIMEDIDNPLISLDCFIFL